MSRHQILLKRYAVLNNRAFLIYKDDIAFRAYPQKPTVVIPLAEIVTIALRPEPMAIRATAGSRQYENMYIIEMNLQASYSTISQSILNFPQAKGNDLKGGRLGGR